MFIEEEEEWTRETKWLSMIWSSSKNTCEGWLEVMEIFWLFLLKKKPSRLVFTLLEFILISILRLEEWREWKRDERNLLFFLSPGNSFLPVFVASTLVGQMKSNIWFFFFFKHFSYYYFICKTQKRRRRRRGKRLCHSFWFRSFQI